MDTLLIALVFLLLFVTTLISWLRRRDALSANVMLIFASVATLFVLAPLQQLFGTLPDVVLGLALAFLLAQPLFTLRLAARVWPIPAAVLLACGIAYLVTVLPLLVLPLDGVGSLLIGSLSVFVAVECIAAAYLWLASGRRAGAARIRLRAASGATGMFAIALLLATSRGIVPGAPDFLAPIGRLLGVVAVGAYLLAFLPPGWLRRLVRATAAFDFTQRLTEAPPDEPDGVWHELTSLAEEITGAQGVMILTATADGPVRVSATTGMTLADPGVDPTIELPLEPMRECHVHEVAGPVRDLASVAGAQFVSVIPFALRDASGALLVFRANRSLFATDDRALLEQLVSRAVVFAERASATAQHKALSTRLAAMVGELERASQAKSDFLASMSHELRTPLSAIIGFSALMRDEPLEEARRSVPDEWIEHVHRSGEHLLALINDVLDLTKIEAGRIDLQVEPFDLASALGESVGGLRPLADRKQIELSLECEPATIRADRGRVRQIVYNLLSNAIKFTPDSGRVSVAAHWDGDDAHIVVTDTGVGIAEEDHEHVFEEFRQVGDTKAREAGTGLGLALSRRLAEAHGGWIELTSAPGAGSRFEVVLPASRAAAASVPEAVKATTPEGEVAGEVLVIEDDPSAVRLLRTYLEGDGYHVSVATDGEAGIEAARRERPQAIVLDLLLPGLDGWEVLRRLKADERLRDIPVVVVSVVDERGLTMSLGAVDYFLKPVDRDALLQRLSCYTFTTKVKTRTVRVLAVDDDPAALDLVTNALRPEGFEVTPVSSGRDALAAAEQTPFDLVICDLLMPDMDGFEVVNRLQQEQSTVDIPILILTAQELTAEDRQRLRGKTVGILDKGTDLRAALQSWVRRATTAARKAAQPSAGAGSVG